MPQADVTGEGRVLADRPSRGLLERLRLLWGASGKMPKLERTLAGMDDPLERAVYRFTVEYIAAAKRGDFEGAADLMTAHLAALRERGSVSLGRGKEQYGRAPPSASPGSSPTGDAPDGSSSQATAIPSRGPHTCSASAGERRDAASYAEQKARR